MFDLILLGGGLANGLIAMCLKQKHPDLNIIILEKEGKLGGNHIWSFYPTDLSRAQLSWVDPLIEYSWSSYEVRFPKVKRILTTGYRTVSSAHFHSILTAELQESVRTGVTVSSVQPNAVTLNDGTILKAKGIIDGRGFRPDANLVLAYQKFWGQIVRLQQPHDLQYPIIMDVEVAQIGGYRFVYVLPLSADRVLIEDTYYSDYPDMNDTAGKDAIQDYARDRGWQIAECLGEETGILPIALGGDIDAYWDSVAAIPASGLRALLFHATTGYSFPYAVRLADFVATIEDLSTDNLYRKIAHFSKQNWREQKFLRFLNRMLFRAAKPHERWQVLQRFYALNSGLIERFYAGQLSLFDKIRILSGKPPVPVLAALGSIKEPLNNSK